MRECLQILSSGYSLCRLSPAYAFFVTETEFCVPLYTLLSSSGLLFPKTSLFNVAGESGHAWSTGAALAARHRRATLFGVHAMKTLLLLLISIFAFLLRRSGAILYVLTPDVVLVDFSSAEQWVRVDYPPASLK